MIDLFTRVTRSVTSQAARLEWNPVDTHFFREKAFRQAKLFFVPSESSETSLPKLPMRQLPVHRVEVA